MRFRDLIEDYVDYNIFRHDKWFTWFAWYPVKIGRQIVWLEWVEKCIREDCLADYRHTGDTEKTFYERIYKLDNSIHKELTPKIMKRFLRG